MDYRKQFIVKPGEKLNLAEIDPGQKGGYVSNDVALPEITKYVTRMAEMQALLYANADQSLLVVLQALDAAGKDGVVRHLFSGIHFRQSSRRFGHLQQPDAIRQ